MGSRRWMWTSFGVLGACHTGTPAVAPSALGHVAFDRPEVLGAFSPDRIADLLQEHVDEVAGCQKQAADRSPLGGDITLSWELDEVGSVLRISSANVTVDAAVEKCLVQHLHAWRFGAPYDEGPVKVRQTLHFVPAAAKLPAATSPAPAHD